MAWSKPSEVGRYVIYGMFVPSEHPNVRFLIPVHTSGHTKPEADSRYTERVRLPAHRQTIYRDFPLFPLSNYLHPANVIYQIAEKK